MTIVRAPRDPDRWTRIPNTTIDDVRLSFKALGLLVYILSKPDHWNVSREHLATTHADGQAAVRTALRELRTAGYIVVEHIEAAPGRLAGRRSVVYDTPQHGTSPTGDDGDRPETDRSDQQQVVSTEVVTTEAASTETRSPTDVDDRPEVDELCVELADAIGTFRGGTRGGRPAVTARWHRDMRLLLDRGPLGGDAAVGVTRDNVHGFIQVVFTELADPDGGGFCWAAQVQSPQAIRRHWWKVRQAAIALHQRSRHGKLAAVSRAVTGEEPEDLSEVLARHERRVADRHAALAGPSGQLALGAGA